MSDKNASKPPEFEYQDPFSLSKSEVSYRLLTPDHVRVEEFQGKEMLVVDPGALEVLSNQAMRDVSFLLRSSHHKQVADILDDPESSENDRFVALAMLKNAEISARFELANCQDTGTAIVIAKKGQQVWTGADDAEHLSKGIWKTYQRENLRYSQVVPLSMFDEVNSGSNMPAQIDIAATQGMTYEFLFLAKGGGSANKTFLYQETKALLAPEALRKFLIEKMKTLGTAACPPYHIAVVIGGTSAESCLKTVKLAGTGYLDGLPISGNSGGRAFRDPALERELLEASRKFGYGAQFGGKYFAHDVRVVRLPRHGASCPVGIGVSCSADRNILARIDRKGLWLEQLERNPGRFIPARYRKAEMAAGSIKINMNRPMQEIRAELSKHKVGTRLSLDGCLIVARDMAHARLKERLDRGEDLPRYFKDHPIYYAGPAKAPKGKPSGSFGPTTAGRMDPYVDLFQSRGGSLVMIAKGNRSRQVTDACKKHGGFYLGSPGGPAALLAEENIKKVEVLDFQELGMEAVWAIDVVDFPAFILIDDKGNDFFAH